AHMNFAFEVVRTVRNEQPELWTTDLVEDIKKMLSEAVDCEMKFADDVLGGGITGMSLSDTREYLQFVADSRLQQLGIEPIYGSKNPFDFMALQDVQELTNFFEKTVTAYQVGVEGEVEFSDDF
ncbi:MAG: ribonucleotide-diphosphate reductase subunit beta, partial [Acidimicrobiales bacterium]